MSSRPPQLMGKVAWLHASSDIWKLAVDSSASPRLESNCSMALAICAFDGGRAPRERASFATPMQERSRESSACA